MSRRRRHDPTRDLRHQLDAGAVVHAVTVDGTRVPFRVEASAAATIVTIRRADLPDARPTSITIDWQLPAEAAP